MATHKQRLLQTSEDLDWRGLLCVPVDAVAPATIDDQVYRLLATIEHCDDDWQSTNVVHHDVHEWRLLLEQTYVRPSAGKPNGYRGWNALTSLLDHETAMREPVDGVDDHYRDTVRNEASKLRDRILAKHGYWLKLGSYTAVQSDVREWLRRRGLTIESRYVDEPASWGAQRTTYVRFVEFAQLSLTDRAVINDMKAYKRQQRATLAKKRKQSAAAKRGAKKRQTKRQQP